MPRELTEYDIRILRKLAPECEDLICNGTRTEFRSILPPVANHYSTDEHDFKSRLERLTNEELEYLIEQMRSGSESVGCISPFFFSGLLDLVTRRLSKRAAQELFSIYENDEGCG
ncbi:hypothetical protein FTO68_06655 [Methanocalculus taiwanensis]|uniref:Uncharacterized protein n=1 Tax=Methanocalculus taiwanensis TaxID=106207 RepID=A0ABD4TI96_9EURY|nr:hypothetical protein [Methanocalculus taiwanensis]MCQ1538663.1 hypothetical protein [Methanocalculus taiwanensis]